jgi:F-type H+-transporting ATPase subunit epsilon
MAKVNLQIIQPTAAIISGEYDHVILPGIEGYFGVSSEHTPFITILKSGVAQLFQGDKVSKLAIHDGFCTVENNQVTILCETLEREEEIDKTRAEKAKERAQKRMKSNDENINFRRAESALKRSLTRLEAKGIDIG